MHIHILGIAGTMTASLAVALKKQGHCVTGTDQVNIYPPISTLLKKSKIPINTTNIDKDIDLCIIGSSYLSFNQTRQEFDLIKSQSIPYISATKYIAKNVGKKNTILVAGTYGKTTITSLLVWIFLKAGLNPSYMFGGVSLNQILSLKLTNSEWAIIEADESINGLDKKAKFLYYPVKYLILTDTQWEHKESYSDSESNLQAFTTLIKRVPKTGFIVYNSQSNSTTQIISQAKSPTFPYINKSNYKTKLLGLYNQENISAAYTLCLNLGLKTNIILDAIKTYQGISRRMQLIKTKNNIYFYDDFSQSASRIASALLTLKTRYPDYQIKVFFEPHASFLQNNNSLSDFYKAFTLADEIVVSKIHFTKSDTSTRVTAKDFKNIIGSKFIYLPLFQDIYNHYIHILKANTILVHFSSGGLEGLNCLKKIIQKFQ